jgi:hypothetical protein
MFAREDLVRAASLLHATRFSDHRDIWSYLELRLRQFYVGHGCNSILCKEIERVVQEAYNRAAHYGRMLSIALSMVGRSRSIAKNTPRPLKHASRAPPPDGVITLVNHESHKSGPHKPP